MWVGRAAGRPTYRMNEPTRGIIEDAGSGEEGEFPRLGGGGGGVLHLASMQGARMGEEGVGSAWERWASAGLEPERLVGDLTSRRGVSLLPVLHPLHRFVHISSASALCHRPDLPNNHLAVCLAESTKLSRSSRRCRLDVWSLLPKRHRVSLLPVESRP